MYDTYTHLCPVRVPDVSETASSPVYVRTCVRTDVRRHVCVRMSTSVRVSGPMGPPVRLMRTATDGRMRANVRAYGYECACVGVCRYA
jgi:hypothetical protein